jgi:hypothetical protein
MILFIDDEKVPQQFGLDANTPHARTAAQALEMIEKEGLDELYLDHDLGEGWTGHELLKNLVERGTKIKKVTVISLNIDNPTSFSFPLLPAEDPSKFRLYFDSAPQDVSRGLAE